MDWRKFVTCVFKLAVSLKKDTQTMKLTLITIMTFLFFACNNLIDKKSIDNETAKKSLVLVDSSSINENNKQATKFTKTEIENYVKSIDAQKTKNKLEKVSYPNKTLWGGLHGYYLDRKLVLIEASDKAELGFASRTFYINEYNFVKIIYREHFAEWGKYDEKYPSDEFEFDASKMTYSDTLYSITLTNPTIFKKQTNNKSISDNINQPLVEKLVNDGQEIKKVLSDFMKENKPNR